MKKLKIFKIFKKKKRRKFSKRALGLRALGSYLLGSFKKKKKKSSIKFFQFLERIQDFQIFQKKKKISKRALGLRALGSYFLGCFKKKSHQSKFSIPWKNSRFPNLKKKIKKIFIEFFFRNRKLWSSSTFSTDATSSQLSTPSILRSMEYVPN